MREVGTRRWVQINGDGVLVSLYLVAHFILFLLEPHGPVPQWIAHTALGVSGMTLLWAYFHKRSDLEVAGWVILLAASVSHSVMDVTAALRADMAGRETVLAIVGTILIQSAVLAGSALRLRGLWLGGSFSMPRFPWRDG